MLVGYFDESGTHTSSNKCVVAGLIGRTTDWDFVSEEWSKILGVKAFHYTHLNRVFGNGAFKGIPKAERTAIIEACAEVVGKSDLLCICGGFWGNWERAISVGVDWKIRFPSCYSYCLEMCLAAMEKLSITRWNGEPIELIFSQQDEFRDRAHEVFRTIKGAGQFPHLLTLNYAPMKETIPLQVADMLAYETYRILGETDQTEFMKWPLTKQVLVKDKALFGGFGSESAFVRMMRETDLTGRQYYKTVL